MPVPVIPARLRRPGVAAGVVLAVVALLLSHSFGRAEPTGNYRPLPTIGALETGCYPLPGGARLDELSHQVRRDRDVETPEGMRRELRGQYNLVDRDEAVARIVAAFTAVGFREVSRDDDHRRLAVELTRGEERVGVAAEELPETSEETLVRGEFELDLPVVAVASARAVCSDPKSTKRWGERRVVEDERWR
jgi:hypothetical protein